MERNWLIRTTQNQILGPVAKQKLLEFIQKGALGMMDEVSSGNGYWFSIKEKDLVDKYIHGDIPQSYNPISETASVLSKKDNPDKTTSINTAPLNKAAAVKESLTPGITPAAEDLDFPDITTITKIPTLNLAVEDDTKLPDAGDLEFPDVSKISSAVKDSFMDFIPKNPTPPNQLVVKLDLNSDAPVKSASEIKAEMESIVLPTDDDLAFPDLDDKTSPKVEKGKVDLSHQYTRTVALDNNQLGQALPVMQVQEEVNEFLMNQTHSVNPLTLNAGTQGKTASQSLKKIDKLPANSTEERKLLHDRKMKSTIKSGAALRDPSREKNYIETPETEPLKKRNDNYLFFILVILVLIIVAVFFYFKEILNKPLPV
jgi:hypothetical protein